MSELFSTLPSSLHIGVLRGGPGADYETSLVTGDNVLNTFRDTHAPLDIFISEDGKWHMNGVERSPERILKNVDVVWNALHGAYGEDGGVQEILDAHGVLYTGSGRYPSAITRNRFLAKQNASQFGIKTPVSMLVRREDILRRKAKEIFESIPNPLVVKPAKGGYTLAYYKMSTLTELLEALEQVLAQYDSAIVEEYIPGKHVISGAINNFRGQSLYALAPAELSIITNEFMFPGSLSEKEKREVEEAARLIHKNFDLRHFSTSDFVVSPRRGVYFLESNTSPRITGSSPFIMSLSGVGVSTKDFLHHTIALALNRK